MEWSSSKSSLKRFVSRTMVIALLGTLCAVVAVAETDPNGGLTPGTLCSPDDPNFANYDYPEHIARCERNVTREMKQQIADSYGGIPESEWSNYEFDHLIPLCAGGSSSIANLWPQPIDEAHEKDKVEDEVCRGMRAGTMTQAQAIQKIMDWFNQ
jgi:hypothetical protein